MRDFASAPTRVTRSGYDTPAGINSTKYPISSGCPISIAHKELLSGVLMETPSLQRIRYFFQLTSDSYTNPVQFPYKIEAPVPASDDKKAYIEKWLSDREAVHPLPHSLNHLKRPLSGMYYGKIEIKPLISLHSRKRAL